MGRPTTWNDQAAQRDSALDGLGDHQANVAAAVAGANSSRRSLAAAPVTRIPQPTEPSEPPPPLRPGEPIPPGSQQGGPGSPRPPPRTPAPGSRRSRDAQLFAESGGGGGKQSPAVSRPSTVDARRLPSAADVFGDREGDGGFVLESTVNSQQSAGASAAEAAPDIKSMLVHSRLDRLEATQAAMQADLREILSYVRPASERVIDEFTTIAP